MIRLDGYAGSAMCMVFADPPPLHEFFGFLLSGD